jgi:hypothetical protein
MHYIPKAHYYGKVQNHLTFGTLVTILSTLPADAPLHAGDKDYYPELKLRSYRGYIEDLEVDTAVTPVTVGDFLKILLEAKGTTIEPYKGGDCEVVDECYMWMGYEGGVCGMGMNGVCINGDGTYTLVCQQEPDWR